MQVKSRTEKRLVLTQKASWLDDFKSEIISFPQGKHDDQVDALVQLLAMKATKSSEDEYYEYMARHAGGYY